MVKDTLGGYSTINRYVDAKLRRFSDMECTFAALFTLMFSERDNVMYERSEGYRIIKTTYGQAYDHILRRSAALRPLLARLPADSVVGLCLPNGLAWIECFWTILRCGHRPLLLNMRLDDDTLHAAMAECGCGVVISDDRTFSMQMIREPDIAPTHPAEAEDAVFGSEFLVMSSGTSCHVKVCAYTAREVRCQIRDSADIIRKCRLIKSHYRGELKLLTFLPFYHIFGLVAVYLWFGFFSRTFVQLNDLSPQTIVNTIRRHGVTHIFAVPLFWQKVYDEALRTIRSRGERTEARFQRGLRLSAALGNVPLLGAWFRRAAFRPVRAQLFGESIRFLITGGSQIRQPVLEFFNGIGYHLANGYGMSELGITSVELSRSGRVCSSASVGTPLTSYEYRIAPDGELLVRGDAAAHRILEGGTTALRDDWFHTRDLAEFRHGRYYILGRQDELVVSPSGENWNPHLLEPRFELPGVRQACLLAVPTENGTEPILLVSVSPHISGEALEALRGALLRRAEELGLSGALRSMVLVKEELLSEGEFKLNRRRLVQDYLAGRLTEPHTEDTSPQDAGDSLSEQLRAQFAIALGKKPEEVGLNTDFFTDEGGTSLDYFALVSQLQEEYSITFPISSGHSMRTVSEFCAWIRAENGHVE